MRRIIALGTAAALALTGCTPKTPAPIVSAAPTPVVSATAATPNATASIQARTFISLKALNYSVGVNVDDVSDCVNDVYGFEISGFTPLGDNTFTIKQGNSVFQKTEGLNSKGGTTTFDIKCTGYPLGQYHASMVDISTGKSVDVPFSSIKN